MSHARGQDAETKKRLGMDPTDGAGKDWYGECGTCGYAPCACDQQ